MAAVGSVGPTPPGPHGGVVFFAGHLRAAVPTTALGVLHIPVKNMICAFGVPGNMIHGTPGAAFSVSPVDAAVAPGMYTT